MDWCDKRCLQLIRLYQDNPILWDPTHFEYKLNKKKFDVWCDIAKEMKSEVVDIRKKMESLLASFRRERQREGTTSGMSNDEVYHSRWFGFQSLQFLNGKWKPRKTKNSGNTITEDATEDHLMNDDGIVEELLYTEDTVSDEYSNTNDEQTPRTSRTLGLHTSKQEITNKRKLFILPTKKTIPKKFKRQEDPKINYTYSLLKTIEEKNNESTIKDDDSDTAFGKYIASELRTFDEHTRAQIKHTFSNVLFEAHMGKLQKQIPHFQSDPETSHKFTNQPFYQQTSQHHYPSPSTSQHPVHNIGNDTFTAQVKTSNSSDSSL